ncbi:MAG TPA: c-type cytochrome [Desulfuromonadales bacterium]|nr:c-type cytochrome [Desulfuromonadales bacterium]
MGIRFLIRCAVAAILSLALAAPVFAASNGTRAQEIIKAHGCLGCHKIEGHGGTFGPDLDGVGKRLSAEQIRAKLLNPKASNPNSHMPSFSWLPPKDLKTIVDYLAQLK